MNYPELVDKFNTDGYLIIPDAIDSSTVEQLKRLIDQLQSKAIKEGYSSSKLITHKVVFEQQPELCLRVFKNPKILTLIKRLIGIAGSNSVNDRSLITHVIHNNAYIVKPGMKGKAPHWHQDDPPIFKTLDGKPLPDKVLIAPMVITCMYYLNDIRGEIDGMTCLIPKSHRFGCACTNEVASTYEYVCPAVSKGTVLLISSSLWHRGTPIPIEGHTRYVFQVSYGRRLIGHKHKSIMNYQMPTSVMKVLTSIEDQELMGFLEGGAYS